jgi:hypothetical protein
VTASALAVLEARGLWRYRIVALLAALAAAWSALLLALPADAGRVVAPWLLMLDTALLGTTLIGALVILERDQGMRAALAVSPARLGHRLAAKVGVLTAAVVVSAVPIALAGGPTNAGGLAAALTGVALTAVLTMLLAVAVAAHRESVVTLLIVLPLVLLPLIAPALLAAAGLRHPLLYLAPTTGAMDLIRAGYGGAAAAPGWSVAWLVLASALAATVAHRQLRSGPRAAAPVRVRVGWTVRHDGGPVRSFLRTDFASIRRDPMLILVGVSPLLLGLAARFGYPPLHGWLARVHGFDVDPYRPLLLAVAVLLHVPVTFGMIGALLVLDDVDDRALTALRTSPLTLPRYLAYRGGSVTAAAVVGLAVAVPLSGLAAPGSWARLGPAVLLAGLVTPLFLLTTLAVAGNKVEGVAAVKLLGLPTYAPVATWWLTGPAGWPFAVLPTWWVVQTQWTAWPYALGGAALTIAALALLARRVLTRLAAI